MKAIVVKSFSNDSLSKRVRVNNKHNHNRTKRDFHVLHNSPVIQRKPLCACDGRCPRCTGAGVIQPKLTIGQPNDKYEREADRVADQVMRMPEPQVQRKAGCSSCGDIEEEQIQTKPIGNQITPLIQRQEDTGIEEEEEETVQAKSLNNKSPPESAGLHSRIQSLKGGGQPLSSSSRAFFEPRFGRDFSDVRVHRDTRAADAAKSVSARAFTLGKQVVFGAGQFSPQTAAGKRLLAHELTHVVQQTGGSNEILTLQDRVQRQTIPIPGFDKFDPCLIVPSGLPPPFDKLAGKEVCGGMVEKLRKILKKMGKKDKKSICPPGFQAGTATGFEGFCCKGTIHNLKDCCPKEQIIVHATNPRCCPGKTRPDAAKKKCVSPPPFEPKVCPPDKRSPLISCICPSFERQNTLKGICCREGEEAIFGGEGCRKKKTTPPPPPPPGDKKKQPIPPKTILFHQDRPQYWHTLKQSVTNHEEFEELVQAMKKDPKMFVQLVAHASSEGKPGYNLKLSKRRLKLITSELKKEGINPDARIKKAPDQASSSGCESLKEGLVYCGERKVTGTANPDDRNVAAELFLTAGAVHPLFRFREKEKKEKGTVNHDASNTRRR